MAASDYLSKRQFSKIQRTVAGVTLAASLFSGITAPPISSDNARDPFISQVEQRAAKRRQDKLVLATGRINTCPGCPR